jgi:hypothetical protein
LPNGVAEVPQKLLIGQGMAEAEAFGHCFLGRQTALREFDNLSDTEKEKWVARIKHMFAG